MQFFKTFVAPHFDFCSTIYLYFPKVTSQKIFNCYNYCVSKLLDIKANHEVCNDSNLLIDDHLESFHHQHCLFLRATTLVQNILNKTNASRLLKEQIIYKKDVNKHYSLRNDNKVIQQVALKNHYSEVTLIFIFF